MLRRTSCEHCRSERRGRWDVVYQWSNPAAFVPVGIHRRVCWCGNWSEPRSDLGIGLQHKAGRRERTRKHLVLQWQFGCRWQPGSALFASHRETPPCCSAAAASALQSAVLPSNAFYLLVPLTKTLIFQSLVLHPWKPGTDAHRGFPERLAAEQPVLTAHAVTAQINNGSVLPCKGATSPAGAAVSHPGVRWRLWSPAPSLSLSRSQGSQADPRAELAAPRRPQLPASASEDGQEPSSPSPAYVALGNGKSCLLLVAMGLSCF